MNATPSQETSAQQGDSLVGSSAWLAGEVLRMPPLAVLHYEVARAWWPQYVGIPWMQKLASKYFAWKTRRVIARFRAADERRKAVDALKRYSSANDGSDRRASTEKNP